MEVILRKHKTWSVIIEKIKKSYPSGKESTSFTGRVCLFKSVISVVPLYYMSFFNMPISIMKEIKKIQNTISLELGLDRKKNRWVR